MKCKLPNGAEITVRPLDEGRLALAGLLAMNSGQPVSVKLSDGSVTEPLGIAEIEFVAAQIVLPA
tara:strand:+ start:3583 stop:3777 length:195 start_codon:yes stop_codon:yes gene_type:complete